MNHKNFARVIAVAVSAALLSGCLIMKSSNSIAPSGTVTSTMDMQVTPALLSLALASGEVSVPNVAVSSLTAASATFTDECLLTDVQLTYESLGSFGTFVPTVDMDVALMDLVTANYSESDHFMLVGEVAGVEKNGATVTLTLSNGDYKNSLRTQDNAYVESADCTLPGAFTSATLSSRSGFQMQPNWTVADGYKSFGNISKADFGYYYSLLFVLDLAGFDLNQPSPETSKIAKYIQDNNTFAPLLQAPMSTGQLPAIINTVPGLKTFRSGKIQGVRFTYKTNLTALKRDMTAAPSPSSTSLPYYQTWFPSGKEWSLYHRFSNTKIEASEVLGDPIGETYFEAMRTAQIQQSYKVAGVVTHTNGTWNKKTNTVTWNVPNLAKAESFNTELKVVLGYPVAFPVKRSMSQASIIKQIKSNTKKIKAASAVSVVAIEDGRLTKASSIKLNHKIAKMRALAVKKALIKQGVKASKITISYVKSGAEKKARISLASKSVVVGIS